MAVEELGSAATARRRHPSARASGAHLVGPVARLTGALALVEGPHRGVASAVLAVRGAEGRTRSAFAAAYGLGVPEVVELEAGRVALADVPVPLAVLTPVATVARALGDRVA